MPSQVREKNILHFTVVWGTMPSAYTKHTPKICAASGFAGAAAGGLKSESENKELGGRRCVHRHCVGAAIFRRYLPNRRAKHQCIPGTHCGGRCGIRMEGRRLAGPHVRRSDPRCRAGSGFPAYQSLGHDRNGFGERYAVRPYRRSCVHSPKQEGSVAGHYHGGHCLPRSEHGCVSAGLPGVLHGHSQRLGCRSGL